MEKTSWNWMNERARAGMFLGVQYPVKYKGLLMLNLSGQQSMRAGPKMSRLILWNSSIS